MTHLTVTKTREYVWRIGPFGNASLSSHNHITCWHVDNAKTGNRFEGGHKQGNNCQSGSAVFARKKDAKAWADGFMAAEAGRIEFRAVQTGKVPINLDALIDGMDGEQREYFKAGAYAFANDRFN